MSLVSATVTGAAEAIATNMGQLAEVQSAHMAELASKVDALKKEFVEKLAKLELELAKANHLRSDLQECISANASSSNPAEAKPPRARERERERERALQHELKELATSTRARVKILEEKAKKSAAAMKEVDEKDVRLQLELARANQRSLDLRRCIAVKIAASHLSLMLVNKRLSCRLSWVPGMSEGYIDAACLASSSEAADYCW